MTHTTGTGVTPRGPGGTHDRDRYPHNEGNADLDLFCRACLTGGGTK